MPRALLGANPAGAVLVAGALVGTSLVVSLMLSLIGRQDGMGVRDTLTMTTALMAGAFGADLEGSIQGVAGQVGAVPLTITLITLAVAIIVFRRVTAGHQRASAGLLLAARSAVAAALVMMAFARAFTTTSDGARVGVSVLGAFVLTLVIVFLVLALVVLLRRDWLRSRFLRALYEWAAAPVLGLAVALALLPLAGLIAGLAVLLFGSGTSAYTSSLSGGEWRLVIVGAIAYAGNLGLWAITLGASGTVGVFGLQHYLDLINGFAGAWGGDGLGLPTGGRLTWFTGTFQEPGLWVSVALTPLCLALSAYGVVRASGVRRRADPCRPLALRGLALWVVSLLGAVPCVVRLANVHAHLVGPFGISLTPTVGASGVSATFLLVGYAAVVAVVTAVVVGALDVAACRAFLAAVGRRRWRRRPGCSSVGPPPGPTSPPPGGRPR